MLRSTLVLLVIAILTGFSCNGMICSEPYKHYDFIQPTFDYARALNDTGRDEAAILYTSDRYFGPVLLLGDDLCKTEQDDLTGLDYSGSSAITARNPDGTQLVGIISYEDERKRIEKYLSSGKQYFEDSTTKCHETLITRAFEAYNSTSGHNGMGFDANNMFCLIKYKPGPIARDQLLDGRFVEDSQRNKVPMTRYKIAAAWAIWDSRNERLKLRLLDEAGFVYSYHYYETSTNVMSFISIRSLSAINLEREDSSFNFTMPHRRDGLLANDLLNDIKAAGLQAPNGDPYVNMKLHYEHAFVEAITISDGALCWSTGAGSIAGAKLVRCFESVARRAPLPRALRELDQQGISIRALETYEYKGTVHLQFIYLHWDTESNMFNAHDTMFSYLSANSWANLSTGSFVPKKLAFTNEPHKNGLVAVDIVYLPECEKVAVFYQHMYTLHDPAKEIAYFNLTSKDFKLVKWMNYPLNAVLYQNKRLYLFSSGNRLLVSKEIKASNGSCGLDNVEIDNEYKQSQMLLNFDDQLSGQSRSLLWPVYDGKAHKVTRNATGSKLTEWQPGNFNDWVAKPIPKEHSLKIDPRDKDQNPATTTIGPNPYPAPGPTPKPATKNNTSIIIVIIIVIIIIGIVCGSVYYFCCGTPDEPIRRPKSAMRKFKTLGSPSAPGQQQPAASKAQLTQQVASSLQPHDTVRSGLHTSPSATGAAMVKPMSKSGQKPTSGAGKKDQPTEPLASMKSKQATTSVKSKLSPVALKSVKSKRSPGPASPKSRSRTSPKPSSASSPKPPSASSPKPSSASSPKPSSASSSKLSSALSRKSSPKPSPRSPKSTPSPK